MTLDLSNTSRYSQITIHQHAHIPAPATLEPFLKPALGLTPGRTAIVKKGITRRPTSFRRAQRRYGSTSIDVGHDANDFFAAPGCGNQIHRLVAWHAQGDQGVNRRVALDAEDGREETDTGARLGSIILCQDRFSSFVASNFKFGKLPTQSLSKNA